MQSKNCPKCKNELSISEFFLRPNGKHHSWCKSCKYRGEKEKRAITPRTKDKVKKDSDYNKRRWAESEEFRNRQRAYQLKKNFDLTIEQYNNMLKKCSSVCEICGSSDTKHAKQKHFNVDHCHKTGKVRGLLCHACNIGLSKFEDNPEFLQNAINYLRRSNDKS